jgi:hypothetical protein
MTENDPNSLLTEDDKDLICCLYVGKPGGQIFTTLSDGTFRGIWPNGGESTIFRSDTPQLKERIKAAREYAAQLARGNRKLLEEWGKK